MSFIFLFVTYFNLYSNHFIVTGQTINSGFNKRFQCTLYSVFSINGESIVTINVNNDLFNVKIVKIQCSFTF